MAGIVHDIRRVVVRPGIPDRGLNRSKLTHDRRCRNNGSDYGLGPESSAKRTENSRLMDAATCTEEQHPAPEKRKGGGSAAPPQQGFQTQQQPGMRDSKSPRAYRRMSGRPHFQTVGTRWETCQRSSSVPLRLHRPANITSASPIQKGTCGTKSPGDSTRNK